MVARLLGAAVEEFLRPQAGGQLDGATLALLEELRGALDRVTDDASPTENAAALITSAQAAERLHVGLKTVQDWCRRGRLEGAKKIGRHWLIPEASLAKLGTAPRPEASAVVAAPRVPAPRWPVNDSSASDAFAALAGTDNRRGHGNVVVHSKRVPPRRANVRGPGTGRKEASTMKHATASALADASTHAIGRRGGR